MVDIVERLNKFYDLHGGLTPESHAMADAAHEIEALRKENREYLTEIINWKEEARLAHERGTGTTAKAG